jgi:hypothetical protein
MSAADVATYEREAGNLLAELGYEPSAAVSSTTTAAASARPGAAGR